MSLTIPLHLNPQNLQPFRSAWEAASSNAAALTKDVIDRCKHVDLQQVPASLQSRIGQVSAIAHLLSDGNWLIDSNTRQGLAGALLYFDNADDLIPDNDPRFGMLDDAIVIELALHEHRESFAAWRDYRAFCGAHRELGPISAVEWREVSASIASRQRSRSFVSHRYGSSDQRSCFQMLNPLPRIDLN